MSGEGILADRPAMRGDCCGAVLADVLGYLRQRHANAALMAKKAPDLEPWAQERRRQLEVIIGDLEAGLHEGSAAVLAALGANKEAQGGSEEEQ